MRSRRHIAGLLLAGALAFDLAGAAAAQELRLEPERPLTFADADGRMVRSTDFAGKWLLVYFGYTHCSDLCPTGLTAMVAALDQIGPAAAHIQPLFVTVDPERDKGPLLRAFTQSFDKRLIGLGGTPEQIRQAAAALGVTFEKVAQGGADYVIDHSSTYTLVDPAHKRATVLRLAEPHMIAARLIEALTKAGVPLDEVNNVEAYR
ncbi:MAG TPA: SCO family protein [Hyphomicrobiaceae bacterium]|nr:SCO family protein [Hyphomicrobiaceae bacterium]